MTGILERRPVFDIDEALVSAERGYETADGPAVERFCQLGRGIDALTLVPENLSKSDIAKTQDGACIVPLLSLHSPPVFPAKQDTNSCACVQKTDAAMSSYQWSHANSTDWSKIMVEQNKDHCKPNKAHQGDFTKRNHRRRGFLFSSLLRFDKASVVLTL